MSGLRKVRQTIRDVWIYGRYNRLFSIHVMSGHTEGITDYPLLNRGQNILDDVYTT